MLNVNIQDTNDTKTMPIYLDCNATTPIEPEVFDVVCHYMKVDYGNAGSRTHIPGTIAKQAIFVAREQIAELCAVDTEEIVFTSGATEACNIAILGLASYLLESGKTHIISSVLEHKAVLEPLLHLQTTGKFTVDFVGAEPGGRLRVDELTALLRPETGLVAMMLVNNETGIVQPVTQICDVLHNHPAYLFVDAAQGASKIVELQNSRIDLMTISAHKIFGPKGVGALIMRSRKFKQPPLKPIFYGGGQEFGLRPGTLPVALIAGLGHACKMVVQDLESRILANMRFRDNFQTLLDVLPHNLNGQTEFCVPHCCNVSLSGLNSEAVMVAVKDLIAISNGAACTSSEYRLSHVLQSMGLEEERIRSSLRFSWCHLTPDVNWESVAQRLRRLL